MSFKKSFGINELCEIVNIKKLKKIVNKWENYDSLIVKNNDNDYDYNPKALCQKYLASYSNVIKVKYNKSFKYPSKIGRWFCKNGVGIQSLPRIIRHTICDGLYIDLDFKNAHPVILEQLCKKNNIKCKLLSQYNNNRDKILNKIAIQINDTKDEAKRIILCALNGNKTNYHMIPKWDKIIEEFKNIHKSIATLPEFKTILKEVEDIERNNINAKVCNRILCYIENECLQVLFALLDAKKFFNIEIDSINYKVGALIFDGLQAPLNPTTDAYCNTANFKILSAIITEKTGFDLEIVRKPFNEILEIPDIDEEDINEDFYVENDGDAAEYIVSKYKDFMVNCNNVKYVKYNNIWDCNEKIVKGVVYNWIFNTTMKKQITSLTFHYYNRDKTFITKCLDIIMGNWAGFIPDNPMFIKNMYLKSKEYLPFANGVYSLREKKLFNYEDIDIQFNQIIHRNFPEYDKKSLDILMEQIIIPILPNEEERKYFIYRLARALAGCYTDKKWFINKGSRNSGKGVITKLLQNAFTVFVGTFNSGSLIKKKFENADDSKSLSWVVMLKDKRLIISQEIDEGAILSGRLIKGLASGGDSILGRVNYQDETEFVPQFTLMLQVNNFKGVEPIDAYESCEQFYCKSKFVEEKDLIQGQGFLKLKDDNVKNLIESPEIIDAFTIYILEHFLDYLEIPESVKISTADMIADIPLSLERIILKYFRHSPQYVDKMYTRDIIDTIEDDTEYGPDNKITAKDIAPILLKCNIGNRSKNGNITINGQGGKGYSNIVCVIDKVREEERIQQQLNNNLS